MKLRVRKLAVEDDAALADLVFEHVDGIEPGLFIVDMRVTLGEATIDVVAQDATGRLVLIALGTTADERMLFRVADAYSWCLESPESLERRYPGIAAVSEDDPPRVIFVTSRLSESFQRKVKQLYYPAVDAVELHHVDVDGQATVYADTVVAMRRGLVAPRAAATTPPARLAAALAPEAPVAAEPAWVIAGGSDANAVVDEPPVVEMPQSAVCDEPPVIDVLVAVRPVDEPVSVAEVSAPAIPAEAPGTGTPPATEVAKESPVPLSESARTAKVAAELGIQLPVGRGLTRQWIEFLNQLAAAK